MILTDRSTLQDKIQQAKQAKDVRSPLLAQIDEWQLATIARVKAVAEQARVQVEELLESKRTKLGNDFKRFSHELLEFKETENFVEHDLTRSKRLLQQLNHDLKQWHQPLTVEIHTEQSKRIAWSRLIYAEDKSTYAGIQHRQQQLTGSSSRSLFPQKMNFQTNSKARFSPSRCSVFRRTASTDHVHAQTASSGRFIYCIVSTRTLQSRERRLNPDIHESRACATRSISR